MKIRIIKENKRRPEQLDEAMRDWVMGTLLAISGFLGSARTAGAGIEGVSDEIVQIANALAQEKVKKNQKVSAGDTNVDKEIRDSAVAKEMEIVSKSPENEKLQQLESNTQDWIGAVDAWYKSASPADKSWANELVRKTKEYIPPK